MMDLSFENFAKTQMTDFAIQFNVNSFGLVPSAPLSVPSPLLPGIKTNVQLTLVPTGTVQRMDPVNVLQVAIKNNNGVYYFQTTIPLFVLLDERASLTTAAFEAIWGDVTLESRSFDLSASFNDEILMHLSRNGVLSLPASTGKLFSNTVNGALVLAQWEVKGSSTQVTIKSHALELLSLYQETLEILSRTAS